MPNPNVTNITPPRVPMIDEKTGYVSREWYRFFYNVFIAIGGQNQGTIQVIQGGTGTSDLPTNGDLLIGNGQTDTYNVSQLNVGNGLSKSVAPGFLQLTNTGVLSLTAGQGINVNQSIGNIDVSVGVQPYLDFDTTPSYTDQEGRLGWNLTDETLNVGMANGVIQQVGQETYARVQNNTGVTIPNGSVVGFAGATSNALLVAPYLADGSSPTLYILGIMTHDLPDSGEKGYCTTWGFIRDLDTSAFSAGDILYASPSVAGGLTNVKPTAPDNVIPIAACVVSDATSGVIFVRPTIQQQQYYGQFSKTADTSPAAINTAYPIVMSGLDIGNGVVLGTPASRIVVPESGLYDVSASFQLTSGSATDKNVWFWIRKNGTDVANSSRLVTVSTNNAYTPVSLSETVSLDANEYVEICWASDSTSVTLDAVAATAFAPAAPSVVVNVTQVQQ